MTQRKTVCLDFYSTYEILDFVQVASDHLGRLAGLDDDALHWVGVAVRESVINAIKHGNRDDERKHVYVEFTPLSNSGRQGSRSAFATKAPGSTRPRSPIPSRRRTSSNPADAASSSSARSWMKWCCGARPRAAWKW